MKVWKTPSSLLSYVQLLLIIQIGINCHVLGMIRDSHGRQTSENEELEFHLEDLSPGQLNAMKQMLLAKFGFDQEPNPKSNHPPVNNPPRTRPEIEENLPAKDNSARSSGTISRSIAPKERIRISPHGIERKVKFVFDLRDLSRETLSDPHIINASFSMKLNLQGSNMRQPMRINFYDVPKRSRNFSRLMDTRLIPFDLHSSLVATRLKSDPERTGSSDGVDLIRFDATPALRRYTRIHSNSQKLVSFEVGLSPKPLSNKDSLDPIERSKFIFHLLNSSYVTLSWHSRPDKLLHESIEQSSFFPRVQESSKLEDGSVHSRIKRRTQRKRRRRRKGCRRLKGRRRKNKKSRESPKSSKAARKSEAREKARKPSRRNPPAQRTLREGRKPACRRAKLYVDFKRLGWHKWVIAPAGYNAYFCMGECDYPLSSHMNATNHATVQAMLHSFDQSIPSPTCVPVQTSSLPMLYVNQQTGQIDMKNFKDMVATSCGCR